MAGAKKLWGYIVLGGMITTAGSNSFAATVDNGIKATASAANYWTAKRLRNAKPMPLQDVTGENLPSAAPLAPLAPLAPEAASRQSLRNIPSQKPKGKQKIFRKRLFKPKKQRQNVSGNSVPQLTDQAAGSLPAYFSSSRIIPTSGDESYPYSVTGRLFFTVPPGADVFPGDRFCSAAVVGRRVVITAGHCLHSGKRGNSGWYTNWRFVPAYRDGNAPYGSWDWSDVKVTTTWLTGDAVFPNQADYGLLVFDDQVIDGQLRALGEVVGTLGVNTGQLARTHVHMLGYPCNIDSCEKMHQVTAQSYRATDRNTVEFGSDMGPGSSGGPWIQNFGKAGVGQTGGRDSGMNGLVGVTSYGYNGTTLLLQGASILDERFWDLWNEVCATPGNCGPVPDR